MPSRHRIERDFLGENTFPEVVAENLGIMTRQQMEKLLVPGKLTQPLQP